MEELKRCPFCGQVPRDLGDGVMCMTSTCALANRLIDKELWQKRRTFVCNDRHGKDVFEGDRVKLRTVRAGACIVDIGTVVLSNHDGIGLPGFTIEGGNDAWYDHMGPKFDVDEIELIEDPT